MATRIDNNSKELNSEQIKETLTNLINKTAQKAVAESSYDRTVLAQIIYCTDASNGQYKIKYQNGYYTAYSVGDTNIKYSDGATVYVLVPQNDLHNRLLIQGLATNDSSQRTYLTFLEEGQQFALHGENWVKNSETATGLNLSSSWDIPTGREVFYYKYKNANVKKINLISESRIISSLEDSEDGNCYFRLGAEFKTDILDYRKTSGNYGIRAVLVFNEFNTDGTRNLSKEYKLTYQLDTFNMIGAPFEFNDYTERYAFFKIDRAAFCRVESISGFVEGFPELKNNDNVKLDIFIKRPSMYAALKLYNDTVDSSYVVNIIGPDGFVFDIPTSGSGDPVRDSLRLKGELTYNGSKIDPKNVEFFWGKKDISVDSKAHIKYMDYLGEGWRCLNTGQATKMASDKIKDAKNYTITNSTPDNKGYMGVIKWDSLQEINLSKSNCKGRTTIIKCCARYENKTYESREQIIINTTGIYLLWDSSEGTTFYNGKGTTDITVGLFQTQDGTNSYVSTPVGAGKTSQSSQPSTFEPSTSYNFVWTLETNNVKLKLPPVTMSDLLPSEPDWSSTRSDISRIFDTPDATDTIVNAYLGELARKTGIDQVLLKNCYQRWSYYTDCYQTHENTTDDYYKTAKKRADAIKADWQAYLDKKYIGNNPNDTNYYILGPSNVTAKWDTTDKNLETMFSNRTDPYEYAKIASVTHSYNDDDNPIVYKPYDRNTLYKFPAALIRGQAKITVSAIQTETDSAGGTFVDTIETQEIYLTNQEGSGLKYDLQITNGNQNFVYSAGGKKPNISIKPLSFQLFDQGGTLVFDSAKDINDEKNQTILEELRPKWKFHQTNTLLKTSYIGTKNCNVDTNESNTYIVSKQPFFYYDIEDDYNVNYKDRSNITLSVSYMGSTYTASTHFTFSKQGDLGTNGTNMLLYIKDNVYEQYRSDVLSRDKFCFLSKSNGKNSDVKEYYEPNTRHLKRTYIYATEIYDATKHSQSGFSEGDFCNLQFAQSGSESTTEDPTSPMYMELNGKDRITLYGYWSEDGKQTSIDSNSTWAAHSGEYQKVKDQTKVGRSNVYDRASFQIKPTTTGSNISLVLEPLTGTSVSEGNAVYYKPMGVIKQEAGIDYKWTAYNVVQCTANHTISSQINPQTGEPIVRTNYGYYQIPFFYYGYYEKQSNGNYKNVTPNKLDPARHFVITGGFDEIAYDADGMNPQYNKQEPFTVRLFDEKGNDITETAFSSNSITITWDCAYGFNSQPAINEIKKYPSEFKENEDLNGQYCSYGGHTYLCNTSHTKSQKIEIKDAKGEVINTFNPGDFVTPYWVPISPTLKERTRQITPPPSFDALAMDSFFSSWVSVQVTYTDKAHNKKYEAAALMPVNAFCNIYGSDEINAWDGKKTVVDDGYIISNKIAAGYKDNSNAFIGITIGSKMITNNTGSEDQLECGLFGYGKYDNSNLPAGRVGYGQTLFLDAKTGLAAFGPRGSTQIILNPRIPRGGEQSWSRLAGWYFSKDFLYKPLYADDNYDGITDSSYIETATGKLVSKKSRYSIEDFLEPPDADGNTIPGSIGMYVPSSASKSVSSNTVWLWASAAGQAALDFTDNGTADVLAGAVKKIKDYFTKDDFPYYYSYKSSTRRIKVKTIQGFCITNITRLTDTYTSNEYIAAHQSVSDRTWIDNLLQALQDYTSEFYNLVNAIKLASGGEDLLDSLETVITNITELNYPSLPIASYPYILSPETPDSYRIDNIKDLKTWYLDNNDYRVTKHNNFLTQLNEYINSYESYWSQIADMETDEILHSKHELLVLTNKIKTLFESCPGYVNEPIPTWNTLKPHKPEVSTDKYTIKNIDTIAEEYGAAAFTASTKAKNYITQLNNQIEVYNTYYTQYQNWLNLMNDPDVAGGAVGYKNVQNKKDELNFYVTYGGEMHSKKATIEGKITAKTGQIGEGAEALLIGVNKSDDTFLDGGSRYFLLWNEAFKLSYQEPINNQKSRSNCWLKGEIFATGGHIGDIDNPSGDNNSTIHLMYKWYPRKLPDNNITWGSTTPEYDYSQGTKVTYSLWSPYFSIISDAGGAVNYGADGKTVDFTYSAGDATFLGRIYATGGRLGDWVCDNEHDILRDPYDTIKLKPALDKSNPASGWINCGMTTIYGDGSIDGCCHVPRGSEEEAKQYAFQPLPHKWASWWITNTGEVHFLDAKQIYIGSKTLKEYIKSIT